MKLRPKNIPKFRYGGNTGVGRTSSDWNKYVHSQQAQHILDMLKKYGEADNYGNWLNNMQHSHANIYQNANQSGDWRKKAYSSEDVRKYQNDYLGNTNNQSTQISQEDYFNYNNLGIANAYKNNIFTKPGQRRSGDNPDLQYQADGLYSSITDWRRLLGRKGDWDENSEEFKNWQNQLREVGWETYLDSKENGGDDYYKLRRLNQQISLPKVDRDAFSRSLLNNEKPNIEITGDVEAKHKDYGQGFDWGKITAGLKNALPGILATGRLAGTLINNDRIYQAKLKGIKPNLQDTYSTHRQIVGDEATKQSFYRMAAAGQTRAARPFTSDADRQMAYQMEARRVGDDLRVKGDLADNQEIRRTSDESNQHQWQNIARATDVANRNSIELNRTNAAKSDLKAQKYAADWTSVDNHLKAIEYRARQAQEEDRALQKQLDALDMENQLTNNDTLLNLSTEMRSAYDDYYNNPNDAEKLAAYREKKKNYYNYYNELKKKLLTQYGGHRGSILFGKEGTKITHKKKEDLLYKSTKDAVEHFRKMSKMSDDSSKKPRSKQIKLASHPGSKKTRKMQQGGVAPFMIYTPVALGGETTTSTQGGSTSTSSKSSKKNETLDIIKDLFSKLEGLPSDVNGVYANMSKFLSMSKEFGDSMNSDDLAAMYLQQLRQINDIKFNKAAYDQAEKTAHEKDSLTEFAVDQYGQLVVQDTETGTISKKSWEEVVKAGNKYNPLTNHQLLQLRANSPKLAFNQEYFNIVENGIGINKIADYIKSIKPNLGSSETTIEGYTKKESNQIKQGFELLTDAPDGVYKYSNYTKDQKEQVDAAFRYIQKMLPKNMKTILTVHAGLNGNTPEQYIASLLGAEYSGSRKLEFDAVTGKGSKNADGTSKEGNDNISPAIALAMGLGERTPFIIQDKTSDALAVSGVTMPLLDAQNHPMANATLLQVGNGVYKGQLDFRSITMGDAKLSTNGINEVLIDGGSITSAELPIDEQAARNGIIKPNLNFLKNIERADEQVRAAGITDRSNLTSEQIDTINKIYRDNNLPIIYTNDGGKPVLTSQYRRFALLHATAPENSFEDDPNFNDGVIELDGKDIDRYESTMKTVTNNQKFKFDRKGMLWGGQKLYKGILYIPMNTSMISALGSTGYKASPQDYNKIDALDQQAEFIRNSGIQIQNQGDWIK